MKPPIQEYTETMKQEIKEIFNATITQQILYTITDIISLIARTAVIIASWAYKAYKMIEENTRPEGYQPKKKKKRKEKNDATYYNEFEKY